MFMSEKNLVIEVLLMHTRLIDYQFPVFDIHSRLITSFLSESCSRRISNMILSKTEYSRKCDHIALNK
jgi:hypothetical protein